MSDGIRLPWVLELVMPVELDLNLAKFALFTAVRKRQSLFRQRLATAKDRAWRRRANDREWVKDLRLCSSCGDTAVKAPGLFGEAGGGAGSGK
jgi:hypothetical protein